MKGVLEMIELFNLYNRFSATHNYIMGYTFKSNVCFTFTTAETVEKVVYLDRASHSKGNGAVTIRYRPNKNQKNILISENMNILCSVLEFENLVKTTKYNRGEIFEKLITEKYNQNWTKDHVPFYIDGDVTIKGVKYQIKYEKATFATETLLKSL